MSREQTASPLLDRSQRHWETEVFLLYAEDRPRLLERVGALSDYLDGHPQVAPVDLAFSLNTTPAADASPLAIVARSIAELCCRLDRAAQRLSDPACTQINDTQGIYYFQQPLFPDGRLGLLFPDRKSVV